MLGIGPVQPSAKWPLIATRSCSSVTFFIHWPPHLHSALIRWSVAFLSPQLSIISWLLSIFNWYPPARLDSVRHPYLYVVGLNYRLLTRLSIFNCLARFCNPFAPCLSIINCRSPDQILLGARASTIDDWFIHRLLIVGHPTGFYQGLLDLTIDYQPSKLPTNFLAVDWYRFLIIYSYSVLRHRLFI